MTNSNAGSNQGKKPVVQVQRRRPSGQSTTGPRPRAQAPRREGRTPQQSGYRQDQTTGYTPSQQPSRPAFSIPGMAPRAGGRGCSLRTLLLIVVLIAVMFLAIKCLGGLGGLGSSLLPQDEGLVAAPTAIPATRVPTQPFVAPTRPATGGDNWLIMLYQDADDKVLEKDIYIDLNEAERVGSTDNIQIVTQIDRFTGGFADDGNWTGTRRYYVTQDLDLNRVGSQLVEEIGEANMADGATLVDFCTWAIKTFPADKVVLIMSDHGMGWPGGWSDPSHQAGSASTALGQALGNQLFLDELEGALQTVRTQTGLDKFELVGLDACLMGQLEVFSALAPHARYAVASEETEPGLGWAYTGFLQALQRDPGMSGGELGQYIVQSYIKDDQRIVDEQARAELLTQGSPMSSLFGYSIPSSDQVASQMERSVTLSAIDLSKVPTLVDSLNQLCAVMQGANQRNVAQARSYAQSFTNIFGQQVPASFIDLGNFISLLKQTRPGDDVTSAADGVLAALQQAVIAERHGSGKPGATGIAIYFPNSTLYQNPATGPASYTAVAHTFATTSLWDDFLTFHYTGRTFELSAAEAVVPESGATVMAPGAADEFQISAVTASSDYAAPGQPVELTADISGSRLGYVMLFAGYYDAATNSLNVVDTDYLESSDTREIDGVYYPVWPERAFTIAFDWEPIMFYISDGETAVPALLTPASYGATAEQAVYAVDGVYTYSSGEQLNARLYFQDGVLQRVYGFTGSSTASAPHEIYPQSGDHFTVVEHWLDLDTQGRVVNRAYEAGSTLTFRDQMFVWTELDAAAGDYIVGFVAQDLDGNVQEAYKRITVR